MAKLFHMFPSIAKEHPIRGVERHAEFFCQSPVADVTNSVSAANGANKGLCKLCVRHTSTANTPVLAATIHHVIRVSPEEEVGWVHAGPHVAMVKNLHSGRDWSVRQFPCKAMRFDVPSAPVATATDDESAIAVTGVTGSPQPTARHWFRLSLAPEAFHGRPE